MPGRVEAIWVKRAVRGVLDAVPEASLVAGRGIEGDASFGRSQRQVTVIEKAVFDRLRATLPDADPSMRRANFMVSGLSLTNTRNHTLTLGGVRVLIKGETRPCERMDEQCPGLTTALDPDWSAGVHGVVLDDGPVRVGDVASITAPDVARVTASEAPSA
jgi:MOSC domain-containing protein YiiM